GPFAHVWVGEDVKLVLADRGENALGHLGRVEAGLDQPGDLGDQRGGGAVGIERLGLAVALLAIAPALANPRAHISWTEHAHTDAERLQLQRKSLRHRNNSEFGRS